MAKLEVIKYGHPTLRKIAEPVDAAEINQEFIDDMIETMVEEDGVGLAAPQMNVSKRIMIASDLENIYVMINPEIEAYSEKSATDAEGCLSLPGLQAMVQRPEKVIVKALDREGKPLKITAKGLLARVIQHEVDHLNGVLYVDKMDDDSLVWLRKVEGEEEVARDTTNVDEVIEVFKKNYNGQLEKLAFDVSQKE
ncbi:peptide deformylase [candidate division KSB1 bacterium RBG_16_48_16]|nr:MAG: peptide deformylase [candidate division KSB1 bacterium RBG_16_48_16]